MDEPDCIVDGLSEWMLDIIGLVGCDHNAGHEELSSEMEKYLKRTIKQHSVDVAVQAWNFLIKLQEKVKSMQDTENKLKTQLISSQSSVIKLQDELISSKNEQLKSIKYSVETSVKDSVKVELQSYSNIVQKSCPQVDAKTLKKVVKSVVEAEDRCRNVMVFGMEEEDNEQLCDKVNELFQDMNEKPRFEVIRVGKKSSSESVRPVKVTLTSSSVVNHILSKARTLRQSEKHKHVFVRPDMTFEQREEQRKLVEDLKKRSKEEPNRRHFIRGGKVCSVDTPVK